MYISRLHVTLALILSSYNKKHTSAFILPFEKAHDFLVEMKTIDA
jgi:hypothetical protein